MGDKHQPRPLTSPLALVFALLFPFGRCIASAQPNVAEIVAAQVQAEIPSLRDEPLLEIWTPAHRNEIVVPARYDVEYESQGRWCAASVARIQLSESVVVNRFAFFYPPTAKAGSLPALPKREDNSLVQKCRLLALWYEITGISSVAELAKSASEQLGKSWGIARSLGARDQDLDFWGCASWTSVSEWRQNQNTILVAADSNGRPREGPRVLVIVRNDKARRGKLESDTWLGGPLISLRSAEAAYSADHQAELARIAPLENPCQFEEAGADWREGFIAYGEKILRDFPADQWTPYIHYMLGRGYAAKLLFYYPNGVPEEDDPGTRKVVQIPAGQVRAAAIAHFRAFLGQKPEAGEVSFAWQEAWRLLAGLPPAKIYFGCTKE